MARAATTLDPFNAIAEARRRTLLELLAGQKMEVNQIVVSLGWPQPMVSKHLGVLKQVGLVKVERKSRKMIYELNAAPLKSIHEWVGFFERFWDDHLQRIKARAESKANSTPRSEK